MWRRQRCRCADIWVFGWGLLRPWSCWPLVPVSGGALPGPRGRTGSVQSSGEGHKRSARCVGCGCSWLRLFVAAVRR